MIASAGFNGATAAGLPLRLKSSARPGALAAGMPETTSLSRGEGSVEGPWRAQEADARRIQRLAERLVRKGPLGRCQDAHHCPA